MIFDVGHGLGSFSWQVRASCDALSRGRSVYLVTEMSNARPNQLRHETKYKPELVLERLRRPRFERAFSPILLAPTFTAPVSVEMTGMSRTKSKEGREEQ